MIIHAKIKKEFGPRKEDGYYPYVDPRVEDGFKFAQKANKGDHVELSYNQLKVGRHRHIRPGDNLTLKVVRIQQEEIILQRLPDFTKQRIGRAQFEVEQIHSAAVDPFDDSDFSCSNCGANLSIDANFCPNCGTSITKDTQIYDPE